MIAFTSGATGPPKGLVRSHGPIAATHDIPSSVLGRRSGEACLATLPIFTLINLGCGATTLIADVDLRHPAKVDPQRLLQQLARWRVESAVAAPKLVDRLVDASGPDDPRLRSLRTIHVGGAPVFPALLASLRPVAPAVGGGRGAPTSTTAAGVRRSAWSVVGVPAEFDSSRGDSAGRASQRKRLITRHGTAVSPPGVGCCARPPIECEINRVLCHQCDARG
jgi:acyl-CoA synthetase (AMP-forming)/AMP-acid ligase II